MTGFVKAEKKQAKLRLAIDGPSGSGKTYTALVAATALAQGGKIAVIDTERGSASLYADQFRFDVAEMNTFSPKLYVDMIEMAENAGYAVIVIDSLSHAWEGEGGALDMVDAASARSKSGNTYFAWRDVTPLHRKLVDAILQSKCHVIATMRTKTEYVVEEIERNGKRTQVPRKVGTAPIQRAGMEYEFTIVGDMDLEHKFVVSKSRMSAIADAVEVKPDVKWFGQIADWLNSGAPAPVQENKKEVATETAQKNTTPPREMQPPTNGNGERPYAPEAVKQRIEQHAALAAKNGWIIGDNDRNMLAVNLGNCFVDHRDDARHTVLKYLTGKASTKDISVPQVIAVKKWLEVTQGETGDWSPSQYSVTEARAIYTAALEAEGQQKLI